MKTVWLAMAVAAPLLAGPVEFGLAELQRALQDAKVPAGRIRLAAEVWPGTRSDAFEIVSYRVSGGDLRGLMYGLLEASDQIRRAGKVTPMKVEPAVAMRGVRIVLRDADWQKARIHDRGFWEMYFAHLARARFNRVQIELADTACDSPQLPYLFSLPFFERVEVSGLTPFERGRNLDAFRSIAQTAGSYGVDLTLGLHLGKTGPRIQGLTDEFRIPYVRAALPHLLEVASAIRAIAVHEASDEMLRDAVAPALDNAGHLVMLEMVERPALPSRNVPGIIRLLEPLPRGIAIPDLTKLRPRELGVLRVIPNSSFTDPVFVRRVASGIALGAALGFEVEGSLDLESPESALLYSAWGRLGYQPKAAIPEERGEKALLIACAARIENPGLPLRELQDCAALLDHPDAEPWKTLAQQASARVRLQWARVMEEHWKATHHETALRAAYYSYRAAARTMPERQADADRLAQLIAALEPNPDLPALPWTVEPRRPAITHTPPASAVTAQPLALAVNFPPNAGLVTVRLHYRMVGGPDGFRTLEAPAKLPRLTIPAADLASVGQLLYYFELEGPGVRWRLPAESSDLPVYFTSLKPPPPNPAEPVKAQ